MVSRMVLRRFLEKSEDFVVVGEANNGKRAIKAIPCEEVDIVLMDLMMPVMDGFDATRWLMSNAPLPILLVSDLVGRDAALNFRAVEAGALDVIRKPSAEEFEDPEVVRKLHRMIRVLANVPVVTRRPQTWKKRISHDDAGVGLDEPTEPGERGEVAPVSLVVIGASTGGPAAVSKLLQGLQQRPRWPVIIIQHITRDFASGMAHWLGNVTKLDVRLVEEHTRLQDGVVYVAPDSADLVVHGRYADLINENEDSDDGSYPSIDVTLNSIAKTKLADETLAILLTGMGSDGAQALKTLREKGAWTVAQDQESSTVWGIPRVAGEIGAARQILSLDAIGELLNAVPGTGRLGEK